MSHQPFETWLLSDEPLETTQAVALQSHLEHCESCRSLSASWADVRKLLVHSGPIGPAPGFGKRWQLRLEAQQTRQGYRIEQEESVLFIGITAGIALLLVLVLFATGLATFESPSQVLMMGLYSLGNLISSLNAVENILGVLTQILPGVVPPTGWVIFIALAGFLVLAWVYLMQKILVTRRITI
jgi:hypothetical protein